MNAENTFNWMPLLASIPHGSMTVVGLELASLKTLLENVGQLAQAQLPQRTFLSPGSSGFPAELVGEFQPAEIAYKIVRLTAEDRFRPDGFGGFLSPGRPTKADLKLPRAHPRFLIEGGS